MTIHIQIPIVEPCTSFLALLVFIIIVPKIFLIFVAIVLHCRRLLLHFFLLYHFGHISSTFDCLDFLLLLFLLLALLLLFKHLCFLSFSFSVRLLISLFVALLELLEPRRIPLLFEIDETSKPEYFCFYFLNQLLYYRHVFLELLWLTDLPILWFKLRIVLLVNLQNMQT